MVFYRVTLHNAQGREVAYRDFSERLNAENFAADATAHNDFVATVRRVCYDPASNPARLFA
jgi:hypothetical protein